MPAFNVCLIKELTDWSNNSLENDLSLEDVTRKSGYSKGYLLRVFKKIKEWPWGITSAHSASSVLQTNCD